MKCWITEYLVSLDVIQSNRNLRTSSDIFQNIAIMQLIDIQLSSFEHIALFSFSKWYRTPLESIFLSLIYSYPNLIAQLILRIPIKEMKETHVPEQFERTLLVFEIVSSLFMVNKTLRFVVLAAFMAWFKELNWDTEWGTKRGAQECENCSSTVRSLGLLDGYER